MLSLTLLRAWISFSMPNIILIWSITTQFRKWAHSNKNQKWIPYWFLMNISYVLIFMTNVLDIKFGDLFYRLGHVVVKQNVINSDSNQNHPFFLDQNQLTSVFDQFCSGLLLSFVDLILNDEPKIRKLPIDNISTRTNRKQMMMIKLTICSNWFIWFQSACFRSYFSYACASPFTVLFCSLIVRNYQD